MTTFICVKKSPIPDDILDGLINDNKIYDGPLGNFYKACHAALFAIRESNLSLKAKLKSALDSANLDELRTILSNVPKSITDSLDELCAENNIEEYESELEKVSSLTGVTILSSTPSYIKIKLEKLRIVYKDVTTSDFWELNPENIELTIYTSTVNDKISINKIQSSWNHPYADSDRYIRLSTPIAVGKNVLYNTISYALNYLKVFRPENCKKDISTYVGKKCSASGVYTYGKGVNCAKTGVHLHEKEAVLINGRYYSPSIVKVCSKCNKESINWVSDNKVITCGECNVIT